MSEPIHLLVVTPDGEVSDHEAEKGSTLQKFYELIECSAVDVVRLAPNIDMWVDDEGFLVVKPRINQLSSYIATRFGFPFQLYAGTAVFSGGADENGDTLTLSKGARQELLDLIDELRSIPGGES